MDSKLSPPRELTAAELPQLNQLVSESFGYVSPHTFFDDFPIWESDRVKRFGIFNDEALVAHVGVRLFEMKMPHHEKSVPMAMIGAVATSDSYRGQGLSSKLLQHAIDYSESQNCDWTLLWGSEHDFYKKFGFELHGEQFQAPLTELEDLPENKIPHIKKGWTPKIFEYLSNQSTGVQLSEKDRLWMANHQTVSWFYHEEPFAYVGFERGLDLPNIIHEYGGNEEALREILAYVLSLDINATVLGTAMALNELGFDEDQMIEEYLCLARPHSKKPSLDWSMDYWVSGLSAC